MGTVDGVSPVGCIVIGADVLSETITESVNGVDIDDVAPVVGTIVLLVEGSCRFVWLSICVSCEVSVFWDVG